MSDRYDSLAPPNLVQTLHSLERRYDAVTGAVRSDPKLLTRADTPGPDGRSMVDILHVALRSVSILAAEATRICTSVDPVSPAAAFDPAEWEAPTGSVPTMTESAESIGRTGHELADLLDGQPTDDWNRTTSITGGGERSLVEVVRDVVRQGVERLREAEAQLEWLRSDRSLD